MKQIYAFETTDGKLFVDEAEAKDHQLVLDVQQRLQEQPLFGTIVGSKVRPLVLIQWIRDNPYLVRAILTD